ncbi:amidase signature domain-containing protein [Phlebopus sp. FC_14]|nr:amidase signature domain-containing protein [Phlebopus sp. FC_14]
MCPGRTSARCALRSKYGSFPPRLLSRRPLSTTHTFERVNSSVNALVSIPEDLWNAQASGTLKDVSVSIKDNICTSSLRTTCSSAMLSEYTSPFDATAVKHLRDAGARIVGKANCDQFGMGSLNINSIHGPVINPHQAPDARDVPWQGRERRSAGGSSGGSAASVAAGLCDASLGTDTGGSVRLPASYCGVAGLKPSYGLISRWGVISYADSLDCVGVLGKSVDIVRKVFDVVSVHDVRDPTAASPELREEARSAVEGYFPALSRQPTTLEGLRIGIPQEYFPLELDRSIINSLRGVIKGLKSMGASIVPVSLPATQYALSAYYVIASAEASSNLARFDGIRYGLRVPPPGTVPVKPSEVYAFSRSKGFGKEVQKRILLGTYALTADAFDNYFLQAQRVRAHIKRDFNNVFRFPSLHTQAPRPRPPVNDDGIDVLLHPSSIRTAPPLPPSNAKRASVKDTTTPHTDDPPASTIDEYLQDIMTVPASLAGLPALSVPMGLAGEGDRGDGWPVGVSVVGQWGCDELVMCVGRMIEEVRGRRG